jgi:hypothetical protein
MITVILKGGLGNILFQYAVGRHVAIKNNTTLRLNLIRYMNKQDLFAKKMIRPLQNCGFTDMLYRPPIYKKILWRYGFYLFPTDKRFFYPKGWGFDPKVLELNDGRYLDGYFQSEKYFKDIEPTIRKELRLNHLSFNHEVRAYKEKIANSNSVGIHIRRGDYLSSPLHHVCDLTYYLKAITSMRERLTSPQFFVFSDDLSWCRQNLHDANCDFVEVSGQKENFVPDFWLLSLCKHTIIPNSTFSWWAAWLNENPDKIVIGPHRWFNDEVLNAQALQDTMPENWVRLAW